MGYKESRLFKVLFVSLSPLVFGVVFFCSLFVPRFSFAQTAVDTAARRAKLEADLSQVEQEIADQNKLVQAKQKEGATLQRDLTLLGYQITAAKLSIKAKQIEIERLSGDIVKKESTIGDLNTRIEKEKESLAELLKKSRELDSNSLVDIALANDRVSDLFADVNSFQFIQQSLHRSFNVIRTTKKETEVQKTDLEGKRDSSIDAKQEIEKQANQIKQYEAQKQELLRVTKNQESNYRKVLADRQKKKQEILNALFQLRDTGSIPFEKALAYAKEVSSKTGVRPAFILAILTQETNLGENVGRCNRPGDPPSKSWKSIMKPDRDYDPFLRITKSLGVSPDTVALSCPLGGGYGGAMGPSQFIPSTWELYIDRIAGVTGNNPPNPWNAEDAFAATGLLLKDLGASTATYSAERKAALKYYAGGNWNKPKNAFYGNSVMAYVDKIQKNIDYLQSN